MNSHSPLLSLSIILPAYNAEKILRKSIEPLFVEKYDNWQLIIVNDGSTDKTRDIAEYYCHCDKRISLLNHTENKGLSTARITGIKAATGDYVSFLDAGDRYHNNALQTLATNALQSSADIDIYLTKCTLHFKFPNLNKLYFNPLDIDVLKHGKAITSPIEIKQLYINLLRGKLISNVFDKVFRRDFLQRHATTPTTFHIGEDYEFCASLLPFAQSVKALDCTLYQWEYSGMGGEYYLDGWNEYTESLTNTCSKLDLILHNTAIPTYEALGAIAQLYFYNLREAYVQRLFRFRTKGFIDQQKRMPLFQRMQNALPEWEGMPTAEISDNAMHQLAVRHILSHKKYYIATTLINLL